MLCSERKALGSPLKPPRVLPSRSAQVSVDDIFKALDMVFGGQNTTNFP